MKTLILSFRPLSECESARVQSRFGNERSELSATSLRSLGVLGAIKTLLAHQPQLLVIAGSRQDITVFGDLLLVAGLVVVHSRCMVYCTDDGTAKNVSRLTMLKAVLRVSSASLSGVTALRRSVKEVRVLAGHKVAPRFRVGHAETVLYLRPGPFSNFKVGGSVGHVAGVVNALTAFGYKVVLLAAAKQEGVESHVTQFVLPPSSKWALPMEINAVRYSGDYRRKAASILRDTRVDFIYQRYSPNELAGLQLQHDFGVPLVLEYNGSEVWTQRNWGQPMRLEGHALKVEKLSIQQAALVVTVSQPLQKEVLDLGVPPERVLFYPNCIDPLRFDPSRFSGPELTAARSRFDLVDEDQVFTFVGTFGRWHGTDVLAEAVSRLIDSKSETLKRLRIRFLFVGDGVFYSDAVKRLSRPKDKEFIRIVGARPQSETPLTLAASDFFLSPHRKNDDGSPFFGSPTKLFEYMAMSKPIILSDLDQLGQVARGWSPASLTPADNDSPSEFAILVTPNSAESLALGIERAWDLSASQRLAMGAAARRAVMDGFTWEANVNAVVKRLKTLYAAPDVAGHPRVAKRRTQMPTGKQ